MRNLACLERNVRLFLLGSAFGVVLHAARAAPVARQRDRNRRPGSSIHGAIGAGKSTLAAWFHDRGFRVIADDVCAVSHDLQAVPQAAPGLPRLRLRAEALELMGRSSHALNRSFVDDDDEKFDVPMDPLRSPNEGAAVRNLLARHRGAEFSIVPLQGIEAADAIFANTYRGEYLTRMSGQKEHWESAMRIVRGTPVFRAIRQWDPSALDDQCSRLLHHARRLSRALEPSASERPARQS